MFTVLNYNYTDKTKFMSYPSRSSSTPTSSVLNVSEQEPNSEDNHSFKRKLKAFDQK
jgi:hypothetical protein